MPAKHSKRSRILFWFFVIVGLSGLLMFRRTTGPQSSIRRVLKRNGIPDDTIKQWIAVSAFETNGWTSRVFRDSNNAFNIIVPGSNRLNYGEGQTIYPDVESSVQGLVDHVLKPFHYPNLYTSTDDLVTFMKSKNYFTSDLASYKAGVRAWYEKQN